MKLNSACKSCRRRGVSRERHTRSLAIGRRGVIIMWGSLQERRATTQVMLGVSLRARWDATLVNVIAKCKPTLTSVLIKLFNVGPTPIIEKTGPFKYHNSCIYYAPSHMSATDSMDKAKKAIRSFKQTKSKWRRSKSSGLPKCTSPGKLMCDRHIVL